MIAFTFAFLIYVIRSTLRHLVCTTQLYYVMYLLDVIFILKVPYHLHSTLVEYEKHSILNICRQKCPNPDHDTSFMAHLITLFSVQTWIHFNKTIKDGDIAPWKDFKKEKRKRNQIRPYFEMGRIVKRLHFLRRPFPKISPRFLQDFPKISTRFPQDFPKISQDFTKISTRFL